MEMAWPRPLVALALVAASFGVIPTGWAQAPPASPGTATAHPLLWRVDGPAGPTWLFGTVHIGVTQSELPEAVTRPLEEAGTVVLEADVRQIDPLTMLQMVQLPEGTRLDALLRPDVFEALKTQVGLLFVEEQLVHMQPWFLESLLVTLQAPTLAPLDMTILQDAAARGQRLRFLETWEQQLAMMNRVPVEESAEDLTRWFDERDEVVGELHALLTAYRAGDEAGIEAVVLDPEDLARHPELYETTLFERNAAWLPTIEEVIGEGGGFVAVGLGHLVGDRGLVALLRGQGYTVERVPTE